MARQNRPSDPLAAYKARRDFTRTTEPQCDDNDRQGGNLFVVQKHDASRLHWDFRLEIDGVLKSWAVTKGPSDDPDVKRLAVRTEDHPLSYAEFEGTIPEKEYGGGTVMLWDVGTWSPAEGKTARDIEDGHLHLVLSGHRMKGEWLLVRMKNRGDEKRENWLLRKLADEHSGAGDTLVDKALRSVRSGRSMAEIASGAEADNQLVTFTSTADSEKNESCTSAALAPLPGFREPQLATLVDSVPSGNQWMHEIKFDGYRAIVAVGGNDLRIYSRNGHDWTAKYASLAGALKQLSLGPSLIDGEIVAYDAKGNPDFSALQAALRDQDCSARLAFHAFDLLEAGGEDLSARPAIERKERLAALLRHAEAPIHVADHVVGAGERLYAAMCKAGQEGIISKKMDAPYHHGRSRSWLKVKCTCHQEFVIVGWKQSSARGRAFASLLMGHYEDGELVYKGKVGTGFTSEDMDDLAARMKRLERKTAALQVADSDARGVTWLTPRLVAQVAFSEFTSHGHIRHGSYQGLRFDKEPDTVTNEAPAAAPGNSGEVKISSRDRVIFPQGGHTKGQLADYYAQIAPVMVQFAANRPLSLVRCPQGRSRKCFFQKHHNGGFGDAVLTVPVVEKDGETQDYLKIADTTGILQCIQMGTIEFHAWCSRAETLEQPDRLIFDLDPDEELQFANVRQAAIDIRERLAELGLVSFAMLTGGKGIHVIVPVAPVHHWDAHADFASRFAKALSLAEPRRFTASMSKSERKGRIFIDWLRNRRGSTAVLPYSARARPKAPVATPVTWAELREIGSAARFTIEDAPQLVERAASKALVGWGFAQQDLPI